MAIYLTCSVLSEYVGRLAGLRAGPDAINQLTKMKKIKDIAINNRRATLSSRTLHDKINEQRKKI